MAEALGISQPNASKHLAVMRSAGLVEAVRDGRGSIYRLTDKGVIGASYYNRYNAGQRSDEEVGADFALRAAHWLDMAAKFSWELVNPGLAEVLGSISSQIKSRRFRAEVFATKRSPTRLLQHIA